MAVAQLMCEYDRIDDDHGAEAERDAAESSDALPLPTQHVIYYVDGNVVTEHY